MIGHAREDVVDADMSFGFRIPVKMKHHLSHDHIHFSGSELDHHSHIIFIGRFLGGSLGLIAEEIPSAVLWSGWRGASRRIRALFGSALAKFVYSRTRYSDAYPTDF